MRPGHANIFLDSSQGRWLPGSETVQGALRSWLFSRRRYVSGALLERMRADCSLVVLANVQSHPAVPFLLAARRLGIPTVGYVASWDHTVGKGLVSPHVTRYVVQNDVMRHDLVRYHGIDPQRVTVTGWPQTDVFEPRRPLVEYEAILSQLDLVPGVPVVLVAGNTPTNAPYEGKLRRSARRLVANERHGGSASAPLPAASTRRRLARTLRGRARISGRRGPGALVHGSRDPCDAAPARRLRRCERRHDPARQPRERPARGLRAVRRGRLARRAARGAERDREHYFDLVHSDAFLRATSFEEVVSGIDRALEQPTALAAERARVARDVVGEVDGRAAERVVDAIVATVP